MPYGTGGPDNCAARPHRVHSLPFWLVRAREPQQHRFMTHSVLWVQAMDQKTWNTQADYAAQAIRSIVERVKMTVQHRGIGGAYRCMRGKRPICDWRPWHPYVHEEIESLLWTDLQNHPPRAFRVLPVGHPARVGW